MHAVYKTLKRSLLSQAAEKRYASRFLFYFLFFYRLLKTNCIDYVRLLLISCGYVTVKQVNLGSV